MRDTTFGRREFLSLVGGAVASAGALAVARPARALAGDRDARVFAGQETFERLLGLARAGAWSELPIGERIGAIGMALRQTPYGGATLEPYDDRGVRSGDFRRLDGGTFFATFRAFGRIL